MILKRLSILFLFITVLSTYGQANLSETHLGIFMAQPIGAFGSTNLNDDGGYAKPGWGIVFDSWRTYEKLSNFGYYTHSTYQWNKIDTDRIAIDYSNALGMDTKVSESRYSPLLTVVGPAYNLRLNDKLELGVGVGAGILFNNTKDITLDIYNNNGVFSESYHLTFDNNLAFAYNTQLNVKYTIVDDMIKLALFADYTGSTQSTEVRFEGNSIESKQRIDYLTYGLKVVLVGGN